MDLPTYVDQRVEFVKSVSLVLQERIKDLLWNFSCVEEGMSVTPMLDNMKSIQRLVDDLWNEVNGVRKFDALEEG